MLNIIELESRWLKYKIKSYIPHVSILLSITLITVIIFSFIEKSSTTDVQIKIQEPSQIVTKKRIEKQIIVQEQEPIVEKIIQKE